MNKAVAFEPLATLTTSIWSSDKMKNEWKWNDRSMEAIIQRFVDLNSKGLDFLGISAKLITDGLKPGIAAYNIKIRWDCPDQVANEWKI